MFPLHLQPGLLLLGINLLPVQSNAHLTCHRADKYLMLRADPAVLCPDPKFSRLVHDAADGKDHDLSPVICMVCRFIIGQSDRSLISGIFPDIVHAQGNDLLFPGHIDKALRHLRHLPRRPFILPGNGRLPAETRRHPGRDKRRRKEKGHQHNVIRIHNGKRVHRHSKEKVKDQNACHRSDHPVFIARCERPGQQDADQEDHEDILFHHAGPVQIKTDQACSQDDQRRPPQVDQPLPVHFPFISGFFFLHESRLLSLIIFYIRADRIYYFSHFFFTFFQIIGNLPDRHSF